jgi:hypothetical protein
MERRIRLLVTSTLTGLLLVTPALAQDDDSETAFEGAVELLYRNVNTDGSQPKFEEDYDGLSSGARLGNLSLNWNNIGSTALDYARINLTGLGGDPYERMHFRIGRKDSYDLSFTQWSQDYLYDLFEVTDDEDGHSWDSRRQMTDIDLSLYPSETVEVYVRFQDSARTGSSLFMKDIQRDLFRLDTPLDYQQKLYSVGVKLRLGKVDLVIDQTRRDYDNTFVNSTEGDAGLDQTDPTTLTSYDWDQRDRGTFDWTTVKLHTPLGRRVHLTFGIAGTYLGENDLTSDVSVGAVGTDFTGAPFGYANGFSSIGVELDSQIIDFDLAWQIIDPLALIVRYRDYKRDVKSNGEQALTGRVCLLGGNSCSSDADCGIAGDVCVQPTQVSTMSDYAHQSYGLILEGRPSRKLTLSAGYRQVDRSLDRAGFGTARDADYDSKGDSTLVFGLDWSPVRWFELHADYEDGDVDRPFTPVSPYQTEGSRARARFKPKEDMYVDLTWRGHQNDNTATAFSSTAEVTNYMVAFWHRHGERLDYVLRYSQTEIDTATRVNFDTAAFGGTEDGVTTYDNEYTNLMGQINYRWPRNWRAYLRYRTGENDGSNVLTGDVTGIVNLQPIAQEFDSATVGAIYDFSSGLYLGLSYEIIDYDDVNALLDYETDITTFWAGLRF